MPRRSTRLTAEESMRPRELLDPRPRAQSPPAPKGDRPSITIENAKRSEQHASQAWPSGFESRLDHHNPGTSEAAESWGHVGEDRRPLPGSYNRGEHELGRVASPSSW